eukprot:1394795-Amorphochlora_amoeboformis.AAC.1
MCKGEKPPDSTEVPPPSPAQNPAIHPKLNQRTPPRNLAPPSEKGNTQKGGWRTPAKGEDKKKIQRESREGKGEARGREEEEENHFDESEDDWGEENEQVVKLHHSSLILILTNPNLVLMPHSSAKTAPIVSLAANLR